MDKLAASIKTTLSVLDEIKQLSVQAAADPAAKGLEGMGPVISDLLTKVPTFESAVFDKMFGDHVRDVLLVCIWQI